MSTSDFTTWLEKHKDVWARVYDEVIAPDLETEWQKRSEKHEKELKMKDEHQQILYAHINNEVIKNAQLVEENARLKTLLQKQGYKQPESTEQSEVSTTDANIAAREYQHLVEKYNELNKRYQDIAQKLKYLERKNAAIMQKNKQMKDSVRAWQEYCDRHVEKQKVKNEAKPKDQHAKQLAETVTHELRSNLPSSPRSTTLVTPRSLVPQDPSSPGSQPRLAPLRPSLSKLHNNRPSEHSSHVGRLVTAATAEPTNQASMPPQRDASTGVFAEVDGRFLGQKNLEELGSSQTTQDESAEYNDSQDLQLAVNADDNDVPEVVSTRSLKRKRKQLSNTKDEMSRIPSDGTPVRPFRVKEEQFSSPPLDSLNHELQRKDTIDLDELGSHVIRTPRKRLRRNHSIHNDATGNLQRDQRYNSAPPDTEDVKTELFDEHIPMSRLAVPSLNRTCTSLSEGDEPNLQNVLQPLDPNVVSNPSKSTSNQRVQKEEARRRAVFQRFGESGELPPPMDENEVQPPPSVVRARHNRRLKAGKETLLPANNTHRTPKVAPQSGPLQVPTPPSSTSRPPQAATPLPVYRKSKTNEGLRATPATDKRPVWTMAPVAEPSRKAPAPPPKNNVPLRSKPASELQLSDFKPNPNYNRGYSHAFSETVRKRGDRMCLPGCTNPSCCGSTFRTLAAAAAPLSSPQEEALLQDYLGSAYDSFGLTQMAQEERQELVLQARTRKMAKEHGKHRQAYEGRKTPPGFWRIGFPSTQEMQEDSEKAAQMERDMVRERWLEAMRKGGKWVFRDE